MTSKAKRNYDYTVSAIDRSGNELIFRDICGSDLEFLDHVFNYDSEGPSVKNIMLDQQQALDILSLLRVHPKGYNLSLLTNRNIERVFSIVREEILVNYIPKVSWLKHCYGIQDGSFVNLKSMEEVPMSKFSAMVEIHQEALKNLKNPPQNDRG